MLPDQPDDWQDSTYSLPPFVLAAYPELASLRYREIQQRISAAYQHNRTIQQAVDALSRPHPTQGVTPSLLATIMTMVEELLDQLGEMSTDRGLFDFLRTEHKLCQENRDRLSALLDEAVASSKRVSPDK